MRAERTRRLIGCWVFLLLTMTAAQSYGQKCAACRLFGIRPGCPSNCHTCQPSCGCTANDYVAEKPGDASQALEPEAQELLSPEEMADLTAPSGDTLPIGFGIAGAALGAPNMIGDNFGNGAATTVISRVFQVTARGDLVGPNIAFEVGTDMIANDIFSTGSVLTVGTTDSVAILEPVPPTDAPTPSGSGFTFAGGTATTGSPFTAGSFWDIVYAYNATVLIPAGGGGGGGGDFVVGRVKLAENASPLPQDRVFVNYSFFDNVPLQQGGVNVNRFMPGFEKTFFDGMMSLEVRAPFAITLSADVIADGPNDTSHGEFGDLFLSYKALLDAGENWAVAGGLSVTVPTAADSTVSLADGTPLVKFENSAVHVMPYVAGLLTGDRWFAQGFLQVDADVNGDRLLVNSAGSGLQPGGRLQETTLLYVDAGIGYWLRQGNGGWIEGIAPTMELHYNRSLQDTDIIRSGRFQIGQPLDEIQVLNAVVGATLVTGESNISIGYSTPIGNGTDQVFDGELRVIWNRWL